MRAFLRDLAFAARSLRNNPGFAAIAIVTLALGIGASTAIFSVVNGVLLRPLPYGDADRLVIAWGDMRNRGVTDFPFPPGDVADMRKQGTLFEDFAGVWTFRTAIAGDGVEPENIQIAGATVNLFKVLKVKMALGRDFVEEDGVVPPRPPQPPQGQQQQAAPQQPQPITKIILGYDFWKSRYGGDSAVIGKRIDLGQQTVEIVGVVERGFELLFPPSTGIARTPAFYSAARIDFENASRNNVFLRVVGRLKPGVTPQSAEAQLEQIASDLRNRFPIKKTADLHIRAEPMLRDLVDDVRRPIVSLMGAVIFVLLIACANVANLLIVRASRRERELAVRAALGGSQSTIVRQLFAESVFLALCGAALGLVLARIGIDILVALAPPSLPRVDEVSIDPLVLGFTVGLSLLSAIVFGLMPAIRASRPDLMDVLRATGRAAGPRSGAIVRHGVVIAEVALSFVLLVGSGLMLRSFWQLQRVDPGFNPNGALTFYLANNRLQANEESRVYVRQVKQRLSAIPGVTGVTAAQPLPLDGLLQNLRWGPLDAAGDPSKFKQANVHVVLPGYFKAMQGRVIAGREFAEDDNVEGIKNIIIDDMMAAQAFPGVLPQQVVGKQLLVRVFTPEPEILTVIGVVQHQYHAGLTSPGPIGAFVPDGMLGHGAVARWVVRTNTGDPMSLVNAVRTELRQIDALVPIGEVKTLDSYVDRAMAPTRFVLALTALFAAIAAILACVGLYGVLSTVVRMRTPEIGLRMTFGATTSNIFRLVVGQGLKLSAIGIVVGIVGATLLTRVIANMLIGVKPTDPLTYVTMTLVFTAIAFVACWIPAARAMRLDPTVAIREEA